MKATIPHPRALCDSTKTEDTFTIIWDSGASSCISFDKNDFVGPLTPVEGNAIYKGITNGLRIEGVGHVLWSVMGTLGQLRHLNLPAYYIHKIKQRLLSPTVFKKTYPNNRIILILRPGRLKRVIQILLKVPSMFKSILRIIFRPPPASVTMARCQLPLV